MARLTIEQIRAPNLSVASQATKRAGEAFNRGISNASDLLSKYQEGLQSQGDAELTNLLAGAKNEDEWNSIIASTDFSKMNLSPGMRQQIINRRNNILGYQQARADTRNTQATTAQTYNNINLENNRDARANDLHGVQMADNAWRQNARAENASLAGLALASANENMTNGHSGLTPENVSGLTSASGTNFGPRIDGSGIPFPNGRKPPVNASQSTRDMLARTLQMEAGNQGINGMIDVGSVIRNRVTSGNFGNDIKDVIMKPGQFSSWNSITGYAGGKQGQNVDFTPSKQAYAAADAVLSGNYQDRTGGATHYYAELPNSPAPSWTNSTFHKIDGSHYFGNADGVGTTNGSTGSVTRQRVTTNPNMSQGPAERAYQAALANSKYQSTSDILAAYNQQYDYSKKGQAEIDKADANLAKEAIAQQILDLAKTSITPSEAIIKSRRTNPGATAQERLKMESKILEQTGDGGALSAAQLQIGTTGASPADIGIANTILTDIKERQKRDPFQFAQVAAESFVDNPVGQLQTAMKGFNISTVPAELESAINTLASNEGISRAEAAYSFARAAEIDTPLVPDLSFFGDNLSQDRAATFAREHFTGDAAAIARAALNDDRIVADKIKTVTSNLGNIERKIQKLRQQGKTVSDGMLRQRNDIRAQLRQFYEQYGNRGQNPNNPQAGAKPNQNHQDALTKFSPFPGAGIFLGQSIR